MAPVASRLSAIPELVFQGAPVVPVFAAELEWYLCGGQGERLTHADVPEDFFHRLREEAKRLAIPLEALDLERGPAQLELALPPTKNLCILAEHLANLKKIITEIAATYSLKADFSAKPFADTYGSGIHIHAHLENTVGENLFWKEEEEVSPALSQSLAGLLATMHSSLPIFLPSDESWRRIERGWHAPVSACWGGNNRTVALRLPDGTASLAGPADLARHPRGRARRIEHRVAGSDADPAAVITAILEGIRHGLIHQPPLPAPIFGDAGDAQYLAEGILFWRVE